jgi:phosphonoacetate hydrolase
MATPNSVLSIKLHGRTYRLPQKPTVVVCVDGFDPEYLDQGIKDGILPTMETFVNAGFHATAKCTMPSVTNPNNCSIITGVPTSVHGIATNFFLDRETGKEYMILDDSLLRGSTILEQMSKRGVRVAAITAKDKLRKIINHGLVSANGAICFSAQYPKDCTEAEHGITDVETWLGRPAPQQYSGDLSLYVLDAGIKLVEEKRSDLLYLTLSDFVQHKYAPGSKEANEFMSELDTRLGELVRLGATVAVTGDHGMSAKTREDGTPNVLFLEDELERTFGTGIGRVICPIADPFVQHHGALGSFVRIYLNKDTIPVSTLLEFCRKWPQVELALSGPDAAEQFEMPLDREGDIVVVAKHNAVIGARTTDHDLSNLGVHKLRSHGGLSEQPIPLLRSLPVNEGDRAFPKQWRNFDIFDLVLNW